MLRPILLVGLDEDSDKNVDAPDKKVCGELFPTTNENKRLGLYAPDIYTGFDGGGLIY